MKPIIITVLLVVFLSAGAFCMSPSHDTDKAFLSSDEACSAARAGFMKLAGAFPPEYIRAMEHAQAGTPLLVERLGRKDSFYYIVPFERDGKATLLIIVDAQSGDFREAVPVREPFHYPVVTAEKAAQILADFFQDLETKQEINRVTPSLVWKPSEQSQSPYEPLWRFRLDRGEWYVDQKGVVHQEIEDPRMKGGASPVK